MEWLFAKRYLISRKSHSVINIIACVSLFAVAVPVAAMIVLLSVFNGFDTIVRHMYAAIDADIEIMATDNTSRPDIFFDTFDNRNLIETCDGVKAVSFIIERQALLEYNDRQTTSKIRGVDKNYKNVIPIADIISLGDYDVESDNIDKLLLGDGVASALGIYSVYGTNVSIYSLGKGYIGSMLPTNGIHKIDLPVCGMFSMGNDNDGKLSVTSLKAANLLFSTNNYADKILVRVADNKSIIKIKEGIINTLGEGIRVISREEKNSAFYRIMRYEKWGIFLISLLVLIIASFSIIGTVSILIVDKRHESITLRAIGADKGLIHRIFVCEGLLISGLGGIAGIILGIVLVVLQKYLHIISMPEGVFMVDSYPVELRTTDVIIVLITFIVIAWTISYLTAKLMINKSDKCDA